MTESSIPQVQRVTLLPSVACVRETEEGVDAVVSIGGRATFLVRRRKGAQPHGQCPLLCFDIRRIADGIPRRERPSSTTPQTGRRPDKARLLVGSPA
jgi:hypothetical protein